MISPHTPPGTRLVVVATDRNTCLKAVKPEWRQAAINSWHGGSTTKAFSVGDHLVLQRIEPMAVAVCEFGARLYNIEGCWPLECFDVAALPGCLTELLVPTKVPEDA